MAYTAISFCAAFCASLRLFFSRTALMTMAVPWRDKITIIDKYVHNSVIAFVMPSLLTFAYHNIPL